eukprot:Blabericola_migrator_1__5450@NODE_2787_length_2350_cov_458_356986_g1174_i3_p1_GENE_NODE_2787_length_2350_cov_458_356986_g1174_i3NODE_2787_length_2350_cov_458_356986_g1174_i3_p1_ORF_typecomplete_len186_score36_20_NODE_2787_length_2350_cov_458_356986_g1174_i341598
MVAIIRSLLSIALIVSAEAALKFVNEVTCKTGKVEVPETTANAKFDTYVAAVKKLITDSTEAVSDCTIESVVSNDGTDTACEEVGTIVTTEVTKTTQCTGTIYGTAATTEACNSNTYKDGFLAVKAPTGCVLTITRTLSESGGNGGEGGDNNGGNETEGGDNTGSSGVTPALTLGCLTAVVAALN